MIPIFDKLVDMKAALLISGALEPYEVRISKESYKLLCIEMHQPLGIVTHVDGMEIKVAETIDVVPIGMADGVAARYKLNAQVVQEVLAERERNANVAALGDGNADR